MDRTKDTYEYKKTKTRLETIEWVDIWRNDANVLDKKRILVVGDSISRGYRHFLIDKIDGQYAIDNIATSKALDNDSFMTLLDYMRASVSSYEIIQFNNGLHGWHLTDLEYESRYIDLLKHIKKLYPKAKIFIALTTPLKDPERNKIVVNRNRIANSVAELLDAKVIDLYKVIDKNYGLFYEDGVHLLKDGYEMLADECIVKYEIIH